MTHAIEALVNPYFLCFILLVSAMLLSWFGEGKKSVKWCLSIAVLGLFIISTPFVPRWLTEQFESRYPIIKKIDSNVQWIVVLSGGRADVRSYPENAQLYSATIKRMVEGVRLYRKLPRAKLLVSGGGYTPNITEAEGLKLLAHWFGIPVGDVVIEKRSKNTSEQAINIAKMIKKKPFYLVTSASHMPRSMMLFKAQGMQPIAAPTDFTIYWCDERTTKRFMPSGQNIVYTSMMMHELLGIAWAKLTHSIQLM